MNYSTVSVCVQVMRYSVLRLGFILLGVNLITKGFCQSLPVLKPIETVRIGHVPLTLDELWMDDRYGQHVVKEQHRWRSASEVFAELCWQDAALAVAAYYLTPGRQNIQDLHLFINLIQQVALKEDLGPVYKPMSNSLFFDPLGRQQFGEDDLIMSRQMPTFRFEKLHINSAASKPR